MCYLQSTLRNVVLPFPALLQWHMPLDGRCLPVGETQILYADVIVPRHITKAFTYIVPAALAQTLAVGQRVLVPFGRTMLEGAVIALSDQPPTGMKAAYLKEIRSLADGTDVQDLSPGRFELTRTIAEYYVAPWGQCLRLVLPHAPAKRASPTRYVATDQGRIALTSGSCPDHLRQILDRIARPSRGVLSSTLLRTGDRTSRQTVKALEQLSWVIATTSPVIKSTASKRSLKPIAQQDDPGAHADQALLAGMPPDPDPLWTTRVADCLRANQARKIVLCAPWEHRVRRLAWAIGQAHAVGKSVIILAGEIARAEWLGRLLSTLTDLPVTVVPATSASDGWKHAQGMTPSVIVGTRSAVFSPLPSIGLIWVDREEDPAFKEPKEPRYHAREVAWLRAQEEGALVVLASAHPSLESAFDPKAEIHILPPEPVHRPAIELVDLNYEPGGTLLSRKLEAAMHEAMERKAGILLFLNRKGYARTLVCRDCGWMPRCPSCAVTLAYSREAGNLSCRYCGQADVLPQSCPLCKAARFSSVGDGTERVELDARRLFPQAKIARLDGGRLHRTAAARDIWEGIQSGTWDILIGTQALFQREPLPRRGLVGILQADSGLHVPDFRAAERTYQLLDEAVRVARPASEGGRVVLQTRLPSHHAVQAILSADPRRFYDEELEARRLLNYPPVCHLAALSVSGKNQQQLEAAAIQWKCRLEGSLDGAESITVLGPVPTMGKSLKGHYRYQILVKETDRARLCRLIRETVESMEGAYRKKQIKFIVDIDPVDMG
jgi:primosomal protein N' (replication factor Y) (superfamily II helicase)